MSIVAFYKGLAKDRERLRECLKNDFRILEVIARVNSSRDRFQERLRKELRTFDCAELSKMSEEMNFLHWIFEGSELGDVVFEAFLDDELTDDSMASLFAYFISFGREVVLEVLQDSTVALRMLSSAEDIYELADIGECVMCACNGVLIEKRCPGWEQSAAADGRW